MKRILTLILLLVSTAIFASDFSVLSRMSETEAELKIVLSNQISNGCPLVIDSLQINRKQYILSYEVSVDDRYCNFNSDDSEIITAFQFGSVPPALKSGNYLIVVNGEWMGVAKIGPNRLPGIETDNGFKPIGPVPMP